MGYFAQTGLSKGGVKILLSRARRGLRSRSGIQELWGTLLHEMCHAFIDLFVCSCRSCSEGARSGGGLSGHGPTWVLAARMIEREADRVFRVADEVPFDLGIVEGVDLEGREIGVAALFHGKC